MKKIVLLFALVLCFACIGCVASDGESESVTDYHVKQTLFDLPPGYELITANYDSNGAWVQAFVRKADTAYVAEDKELLLYSARTTELIMKCVFVEKYDYSSDKKEEEKEPSPAMPFFNEGDTVIYSTNGFTVKRKVEIVDTVK